jgi:hypothetical protein
MVRSRLSAACGALACLLAFGGVGALAFWAIGASIHDGMRAKDWVRVKANVERVDTGEVTYSYEWEGKRRYGDRAGTFVLGGNSDVDDFDDRMEALLEDATTNRKPITVWVNPQDPSESMIDNTIRWKLLLLFLPFGVGFGGAGLAASWAIGKQALPRRAPRAPGEVRGAWAGVPLLKPKAREALFQWAVAFVWNAVSFPIALVGIPKAWGEGNWLAIIVMAVFPLIGALIAWGAIGSTAAVLREGSPFNARSAA